MDMHLPHMRSGGNWFTWPFQVIEQKEIATLGEERRVRRLAISSSS
jgi:dimethylaniline monooxygenase (N-oxide forming)